MYEYVFVVFMVDEVEVFGIIELFDSIGFMISYFIYFLVILFLLLDMFGWVVDSKGEVRCNDVVDLEDLLLLGYDLW